MRKTLAELADYVGGRVKGNPDHELTGVATLVRATSTDISFLSNSLYKKYLSATTAGAVILTEDVAETCLVNALIVNEPYVSYAKIATLFNPPTRGPASIHSSAVIAKTAKLAESCTIGPNCVIGEHAEIASGVVLGPGVVVEANCCIGNDTEVRANVTLCRSTYIGERCLIHPGVVIGADGFGIANDRGIWIKVPQLGSVRIGNDVEIGANTTIDRGALDDTVIEDGVKLDNLIQVAHNVKIGAHTVVAGCVGIAGSAVIGKHCALGGGVGVLGHLQIADGVQVTAMSMVTKSINKSGVYSSGTPLQDNHEWHKNAVRFKQLDELTKRVKELERVISNQAE